jgi:hypothetical protein
LFNELVEYLKIQLVRTATKDLSNLQQVPLIRNSGTSASMIHAQAGQHLTKHNNLIRKLEHSDTEHFRRLGLIARGDPELGSALSDGG